MKIKQIFAALTVSAALMSCNFLDEYDPNATTAGNFYTSEADIVTSLNGVYQSLTQDYYYQYNYYFTDVRAHVTVVTDSGASSGIPYQFYNYTLTEENQYVYNRYTQLFKSISRANTLLAHLDDVSYANPDSRNTYEAEARFIRALTYFHLVTEWGDVPLVLKRLETKDEVEANNYRRPKKEVYKAIFDDLDFVLGSPLADFQPAPLRQGCPAMRLRRGFRRRQERLSDDGRRETDPGVGDAPLRRTRRHPLQPTVGSLHAEILPREHLPDPTCRGMPTWDRSGTSSSGPARRGSPPTRSARCTT